MGLGREVRRGLALAAVCALLGCAAARPGSSSYGTIYTVAGTGVLGASGDGGQATVARLFDPTCVALDAKGNLFAGDLAEYDVRKVAPSGVISTYAGTRASSGYSGDGGPATQANLYGPTACATDAAGNLYLADDANNVIREVAVGGTITTVVGNGTGAGTSTGQFSGDGGPARGASINHPFGVTFDSAGNMYVADTENYRVRKISVQTGTITTIAGNGTYGYSGDGGLAVNARLGNPEGLAVDAAGNLFIAEEANATVRRVDAKTGMITTVAGTGAYGYTGDGGAATSAQLGSPEGLAFDSGGDLYIADETNNVVRKLTISTGVITTVVGSTRGYSGDGGPATSAQLAYPYGITFDKDDVMYVAEYVNGTVRKIVP